MKVVDTILNVSIMFEREAQETPKLASHAKKFKRHVWTSTGIHSCVNEASNSAQTPNLDYQ
jgi:hypothetical protein